jgi:phosphatidylethanolamine-binding protein (PEBP) family uncharacterized protein
MPKGELQGKGDLGRAGYLGPCSNKGSGIHHYVFTLYALKAAEAETERDASPGMILADVMRESLGNASVTYTYSQNPADVPCGRVASAQAVLTG